jgi:hypothetical protein
MSAAATRRLGVGTLRALNAGVGTAQPIVIHNVLELDGRVVAESTTAYQAAQAGLVR